MTIEQILKKYGIVTLQEAEQLSGIKADTLKRRIHYKILKGFKIAKTWLIFLKDIKTNDPTIINKN